MDKLRIQKFTLIQNVTEPLKLFIKNRETIHRSRCPTQSILILQRQNLKLLNAKNKDISSIYGLYPWFKT